MIVSLYRKEDFDELILAHQSGHKCEAIVGFKDISRFFSMGLEELKEALEKMKEHGQIRVYLQWDVLMTESRFQSVFSRLKQSGILENSALSGVRVQDPGALHALKEMGYKKAVHYIVEQGNHNTLGLKTWLDFWPEGIKRLVLSPELPSGALNELQNELPCELEVLGFGPILLFYTPRNLVSPLYGEPESERHEVMGTSEESPHKGFPIIENAHGTFMLNTKDQFLLDEKEALTLCEGICWRVDFILKPGSLSISEFFDLYKDQKFQEILSRYERATTKGFFRVNKTDVLFKKLKNFRLQDRGESYLGEVVDVKKKEHIAILIKAPGKSLESGREISFLSPEGREKKMTISHMSDALGNKVDVAKSGDIVFLSHIGGLSVRTMVFFDS